MNDAVQPESEIVPINEPAEANQAYGALTEGLYQAGFSFERAMGRALGLLKGDLWMKVGNGFTDVNEFVRSLQFDRFKSVAEQQQEFRERVQDLQPKVSDRAIADALGVSHQTIGRGGPNGPSGGRKGKGKGKSGGPNGPSGAGGGKRDARRINQRDTREERVEEKLKTIREAAILAGRFTVFYADPAWEDEFGPNSRQIENHYLTMTDEEIEALDVKGAAADDAILFLWATPHMLPTALRVMAAWGFDYRTHMIWAKDKIGLGQYARNQHELLLIGRRGAFPPPQESDRIGSIVEARVGKHSAKPKVFAELIEKFYPDQPKIELFCRGRARRGWSVWGNEAEVAREAAE